MKKPRQAHIRLTVCLLSGCILTDPTYGQKKPNFDEIVTKFIQKVEDDSQYMGNNYSHQEFEIDEEIKNGIVSDVQRKLFQVEKRGNDLYKKLLARNEIPVTDTEFQKKKEIVSVGAKLLGRFEFHYERTEIIGGEKCWVFSFKPRGNLPEKTREDRALNQLAGEAWIVQETLSFRKLVARLLSEVKYEVAEIGSGGKIHRADCTVGTKTIDGRFAIDYVQVEYVASGRLIFIPIVNKHMIKKVYYRNYERRIK